MYQSHINEYKLEINRISSVLFLSILLGTLNYQEKVF